MLLPVYRDVHGRRVTRQVQRGRVDSLEIRVTVAIDEFEILQEAIGQMPRAISDLAVESLPVDRVEPKVDVC